MSDIWQSTCTNSFITIIFFFTFFRLFIFFLDLLQKIGCDGIIGSTAKEDRCGVCSGDGKSCRIVKGDFNHSKGMGESEETHLCSSDVNTNFESHCNASSGLNIDYIIQESQPHLLWRTTTAVSVWSALVWRGVGLLKLTKREKDWRRSTASFLFHWSCWFCVSQSLIAFVRRFLRVWCRNPELFSSVSHVRCMVWRVCVCVCVWFWYKLFYGIRLLLILLY